MYEIQILTATRAEYGLLRPLFLRLRETEGVHVSALVTGMHLSQEFGMTRSQLDADGVEIAAQIPILLSCDTPAGVSKAMGLGMIGCADHFVVHRPDCLVVLGDRFETLAVCCAAFNERIPIVHLHGGERTEGALDEGYRHAVTKLSYLHFTSTEEYRRRVIQLGESPDRVFNVGAIGVENALTLPLPSRDELEKSLGVSLEAPYVVMTFHPATQDSESALSQCRAVLGAMDAFPGLRWICTKANADAGGRTINQMLEEYAQSHDNVLVVPSLGVVRYLAAVKYAQFVFGNSSSGLLEVPSFGVPTVNIGDRQLGRIRAASVIDCGPETAQIVAAVQKAMSPEYRAIARAASNPYQGENTARRIVAGILDMLKGEGNLKKRFYDLDMTCLG